MDHSIDRITAMPPDRATEPLPRNPIRIEGVLDVRLLGLRLARINLDLTVAAVDRFLDFVKVTEERDQGDLSQLPRRELYELARQEGVEGRSAMTKRELIRALES